MFLFWQLHQFYFTYIFFVLGESIPIRLFLAGYELTPTFKDVNKKFSVRYFLNLVLVDEEERRYFKQQVCHVYYNSKKTDCKVPLNNVLHSEAVALFVMSVVLPVHKLLWHFHFHFQHINQLLV